MLTAFRNSKYFFKDFSQQSSGIFILGHGAVIALGLVLELLCEL